MLIYDITPHPKDIIPSWIINPIKAGYNSCNRVEIYGETSEQFKLKRIIDLSIYKAPLNPNNIPALKRNIDQKFQIYSKICNMDYKPKNSTPHNPL